MAWREFFYFNKGERNGILVLLFLMLMVLISTSVYRAVYRPPVYDFSEFESAALDFEQRLAALRQLEEEERQTARRARQAAFQPDALVLTPRPFNPNNLPPEEWKEMGVPDRLAATIMNFENAGGSFRFKEDLRRIFGMTDNIYAQLEPFIELPSRAESQELPQSLTRFSEASAERQASRNVMVNINQADTLELILLRGIGPSFSRRIVNYRERLGGFHSPDQLLEVFGMDTARLAGFRQNIIIDTTLINRININQAEWADLIRHPYIDRNIANSILAIRRQHGPFHSIEQVKKSHLITPQLFQRLAPYLTVSD